MQAPRGENPIGPVVGPTRTTSAAGGWILPVRRGCGRETGMIGGIPSPVPTVVAQKAAAGKAFGCRANRRQFSGSGKVLVLHGIERRIARIKHIEGICRHAGAG